MKRSGWITGTIVMQALWSVVLIALATFLLVSARKIAPEVSAGLRIDAMVLVVPALLATLSWFGLWKQALWGWWLALLTNIALMAVFVYSMIDDGLKNIDWEMALSDRDFSDGSRASADSSGQKVLLALHQEASI